MEVLALVPARGGSKSIPRKNIRPLAGYPLIAYSIAAGLQARLVNRVIVSTDDDEIARIAREYGAETPFLRPVEFAQDHSTDFPVFTHALDWLAQNEHYHPDILVQLRPTSPIRPVGCVDQAVQILLDHPEADSVRGVVPSGQNPHKMWRFDAQGRMVPLLQVEGVAEPYNAPRQSLPPTYWQTGHIDAIRASAIYEKKSLSGDVIYPLVLESRYTVDIDTVSDWQHCEWLMSTGELNFVSPGKRSRPLPGEIVLVVFDFDGVVTDNRVWTDESGKESVASNRSDSLGLTYLRQAGVEAMVLSREVNPVVEARCRKLSLPCLQGVKDKAEALQSLLTERRIQPEKVVYVGNDTNDLPCFPLVGCAVSVADGHPAVLGQADLVLKKQGGHGAVRELCDMIVQHLTIKNTV